MKEVFGFNPETNKPIYGEILLPGKQELPGNPVNREKTHGQNIYFILINKAGDTYPVSVIYPPEEIDWPDDPFECVGMGVGMAAVEGVRLAAKGVSFLYRYHKKRQERRISAIMENDFKNSESMGQI